MLWKHNGVFIFCFSCSDNNPLRDVFTVQRPAGVTTVTATDLKTMDQEDNVEWTNGEVTLIYSEEAGTQIIQHQDSLTDYCSLLSSCSLEPPSSDSSSAVDLGSSATHSSVPRSADQEGTGGAKEQQASTNPDPASAETVNPTVPQLQAFSVLPVNGTLWIPRYKQ